MLYRLKDFELVIPKLLMFKVCEITGIWKIEFSIFLVVKGLNKIKKLKNHSKPPKLVIQSFFK